MPFLYTDIWDVYILRWKGIKKVRAATLLCLIHSIVFESAPAASGKGMPEAKSRLGITILIEFY